MGSEAGQRQRPWLTRALIWEAAWCPMRCTRLCRVACTFGAAARSRWDSAEVLKPSRPCLLSHQKADILRWPFHCSLGQADTFEVFKSERLSLPRGTQPWTRRGWRYYSDLCTVFAHSCSPYLLFEEDNFVVVSRDWFFIDHFSFFLSRGCGGDM